MWAIYALMTSKITVVPFCLDSQSLSVTMGWPLLMHIISVSKAEFLSNRDKMSLVTGPCQWSTLMESLLGTTEPNLPFKNMLFGCDNLKQWRGKKTRKRTSTLKHLLASQSGKRQAPMIIILWDSIAFGTQASVWSVSWESLSKMRKEFPF